MRNLIFAALAAMNLAAFVLLGVDKARAKAGKRRIPERAIWLAAACFGGLGSIWGMYIFHHKTRKWRFEFGLPALTLAQMILLDQILEWLHL